MPRELAAQAQQAHAGQRRPNLIYVFADQLRSCSCGYMGDEYARTPNMDRMARQGVNFTNTVACTPVCSPYRGSLFTGKYQSSTGLVINELRLSPDHECIAHVLTRGGYETAYIGKWHLWANELGGHGETANGFTPPGPYRLGFDGYWAAYNFNHRYFNAPYFRNRPDREFYKQYEPVSQTDMAIDFIRRHTAEGQQSPFALFLSWGPPHDPWGQDNVPAEYAEMFREMKIPRRPNFSEKQHPYGDAWARMGPQFLPNYERFQKVYYAQTASLDDQLGRLMRTLEELGLAEDTILVFTSDHGEMFGSQGRRAKLIYYDEAARVPFLVQWKGRIPAGLVHEAPLNTPDIMPTLLSLLGLPIPSSVEGMDLSHLALGRGGAEPEAALMQGLGTTAAWVDGAEWRALRDRQYTYGVFRRDRHEELFDNLKDPYQMKNLADDRAHAATLQHYRDMLARRMQEQNDTFEACTWYRDHWTQGRNIMRGAKGGTHDLDRLRAIVTEHLGAEAAEEAVNPARRT